MTVTPQWTSGPQPNLNTSPTRGRFNAVLVSNFNAIETRGPTNHVVIETSAPVTNLAVTVAFFGTNATERMRIIPTVSGQGTLDASNVVVPTAADGTVVLTWSSSTQRIEFDWTSPGAGASLVGTAVAYTTGVCDMGDAPETYGSAHAIGAASTLVLGASFTADLADKYSTTATADTDDALTPPLQSVSHDSGVPYDLTVPLRNTTPNPATLQGWIDFDRSGTFEASESTAVTVPTGASSAALHWTTGTVAGPSFMRLRIHQDPAGQVGPTGPTVGGEVEDYAVTINDAPVITGPATGTVTTDNTPTITGTATPGDGIEIRDADGDLVCSLTAAPASGQWSCTPGTLADGIYNLVPVAIAPDGTRSTGSAVTVTVDTVPPAPPTIINPIDQSTVTDPTPDITTTTDAGTTVTVRDETGTIICAGVAGTSTSVTCTSAPLVGGAHVLTPIAADAAGNTTTGPSVEITVVAPSPTAPTPTVPSTPAAPPRTLPATGRLHTGIAATAATLTASGIALLTLARRRRQV